VILNKGYDVIVNAFLGNAMNINYIAFGSGSAPLNLDDVVLSKEICRVPVSSIYRDGDVIIIETFVDINDANFTWTEIGLISNGTKDLNSGDLIARSLTNQIKTVLMTATIDWQIDLERRES
jgi:hypothetical protein